MPARTVIAFLVSLLLSVSCFAEYADNILKGNAAYTAGRYEESLVYYEAAQEKKPNAKLAAHIEVVKKKMGGAPRQAAKQEVKIGSSWKKRALLGVFAASGVVGISMGLVKRGSASDAYDKYVSSNDEENTVRLYDEHQDQVKSANTWLMIGYCGIGLAIGTHIADRLFFAKRGRVAMNVATDGEGIRLAMDLNY